MNKDGSSGGGKRCQILDIFWWLAWDGRNMKREMKDDPEVSHLKNGADGD